MSHLTQYRSFRGRPFQPECTQTHNNGTVSLTFTETQKTKKLAMYQIDVIYLYSLLSQLLKTTDTQRYLLLTMLSTFVQSLSNKLLNTKWHKVLTSTHCNLLVQNKKMHFNSASAFSWLRLILPPVMQST